MSTSYSPPLSFNGVGSGIDTAAIIEQLMRLERRPITQLETQRKSIESRQGVIQELNGLLGKMKDAASALFSATALRGTSATSADAGVATAATGTTAPAGTYNIVVDSLAQAHTTASAAAPPLVPGQSLEITVGGATTTHTVAADESLSDFAARINGDDTSGVSASVINDKLVLISRTAGGGGGITLSGDAAAGFGFTTTQAAQDASATINGLAVTSAGNTIEGAIADTTITLGKVGATTITVGLDADAATEQVQSFIDSYNALMGNIRNATKYDPATKNAGTLQGDQAINQVASRLRSVVGSAVDGLGGAHDSLAQIGINSSREGVLSLDAAKFSQALTSDPAAVRAVFGADDGVAGMGAADGIARRLGDLAGDLRTEVFESRLSGYTSSLQRLDDRMERLESLMEMKEKTLRSQWQAMEVAVSRLQSQGNQLSGQLASLF
ncbi:MAG: flagellar filament capping protein FliD [Miltoncostaeaceae bacterium]